jgi:two-component system NtrC family sensor kinase
MNYRGDKNIFMDFMGVPLKGKSGQVEGLLCIIEETTDRVKTRAKLMQETKISAIGRLAAGAAHELNNPLTTVTGFAELILDTLPKDSPEYEDMTLVLKEAHRARSVVRRLLDFSRQSEVLWMEVDINELLSNVLALVHHMAQTSGVDVRVELWDELPRIRADRNQMQQVFLNLIHNAIQAMPKGGQLVLRTQVGQREAHPWIAVNVQDNGEGIKAEDLDKVFEPFFTTKPTGVGTGLGLSVSYGIVSDHGGYIDVESREGVGSTFTVWLPVEGPEEKQTEIKNA